jgi:prepilin-type N-terminal cleavage/methylation domain-containing protein
MMTSLSKRKAFTLIELIIVIAIIVIISATAPMLSSGIIVERQVYNAATQIQQDLLLVQNLAITHSAGKDSKRFEIYFYPSPSKNKYYVETTEDAVFDPSSEKPISGKVIVRKFSSALKFLGYADGGYIAFDNQGIPYPSVGVITISNTSESKKLTVTISTIGGVKIDWVTK